MNFCNNVLAQDLRIVVDQPASDVFISDTDSHFYDYIKHLMKQLLCKSSGRLSAGGIFSRKSQSTCDLIGGWRTLLTPTRAWGWGEGKSGIELGPTFRRACPLLLSLSISKTISKFDTCTIQLGSTKPPHREVCNTRIKNIYLFTTITCTHAWEVHRDFGIKCCNKKTI